MTIGIEQQDTANKLYCSSNHDKNFSIETDWMTIGIEELRILQIYEKPKEQGPLCTRMN
jgi:hypothetical protein